MRNVNFKKVDSEAMTQKSEYKENYPPKFVF
jgi:hypothetical protein